MRRPSVRTGGLSSDELAKLEQELTSNALAFLQRAFQETIAAEEDAQQLGFAVVDLAVAIEVLLKARLAREHWTLVLDHPDSGAPDRAALIAGKAKTVTPGQAVDRLARLANVPLGNRADKKSRAHQILKVANLRNRVAHFALGNMEPLSMRAQLGAGLQFTLWFLETEFADSPAKPQVDELIRAIGTGLGAIKELVTERLRELSSELDSAVVCVVCPRCSQPTLMLRGAWGGEPTCPFCRSIGPDEVGPDLADEYVATVLDLSEYKVVKDGGTWPVHDCPECDSVALVEGVEQVRPAPTTPNGEDDPDRAYWGCFNCGLAEPSDALNPCADCGRLISGEGGLCVDCMHALMLGD